MNQKAHREGKLVGTHFLKKNKRWIAQLHKNGRTRYLGSYATEIEAHKRYLKEISDL
jgi:hypothetical protein